MTQPIEIGRLLSAGISGFTAGCRVNQLSVPSFGALVRAPLGDGYQVYGLIHDIHIDDDGLVRQLVTADGVSEEVMKDNRERRIVPVEMSVLAVGYEQDGKVHHLLPPRPPLSLDVIYLCEDKDMRAVHREVRVFPSYLEWQGCACGRSACGAYFAGGQGTRGVESGKWIESATQEVITLLRDDYPTLMSVLGALADIS